MSVSATPSPPIGWAAHRRTVDALTRAFAAIPKGRRIRLAKKTSNLFRSRTSTDRVSLDVTDLTHVIAVDTDNHTADVQGMCTYDTLVATLLPLGFAPLVVPELKTITLAGAATGMGVESTSFRNGLPHESILEMDILTGTGDIVTCSPTHNADLYRGFPNSYGTLGYALRLTIKIEPVTPYVQLTHLRFNSFEDIARSLAHLVDTHTFNGMPVDYLDGVVFSPTESYLVLGTKTDSPSGPVSTYSRSPRHGGKIYYKSIQHTNPDGVATDWVTTSDYLWRWDTDWFWCSRAFGTQNPTIRKYWPEKYLTSSFYWKLIGLDKKYDIADRLEAHHGRPPRERVVQDIEVTVAKLPDFLDWFFSTCDIEPVWLCPIRLADSSRHLLQAGTALSSPDAAAQGAAIHPWPLYPLEMGQTWVNVGFWSSVPANLVSGDQLRVAGIDPLTRNGRYNRLVEAKVAQLGGHKSLYSESFYSPEDFAALYGGTLPAMLKNIYDPDGRFPTLYEKTVHGA